MVGVRVHAGWGSCALWLLLGACSAGEFDDGATFGGSPVNPGDTNADDSTTGSPGPMTTGVSAESTAGAETTAETTDPGGSTTDEPMTTGGVESSTGPDDPSTSTGAEPMCGDGMLDDGEECDGAELDGTTCADVGDFIGGRLACDARSCTFDTSGCMATPADPVEVCESINLSMPDAGSAVSSVVTLPDGDVAADVTVSVTLDHTYIGDLTVDVQHGGTTVRVFDRDCGAEEDIDLWFDDAGAALDCTASTSGAATIPDQSLSAFDGAVSGGDWTFAFQDNAAADTGSVTQICVRVTF